VVKTAGSWKLEAGNRKLKQMFAQLGLATQLQQEIINKL